MQKYSPKEIEARWQKYWEDQGTFEVQEDKNKKKFYALIEFPYPSGAGLHVGHPRPFTAMDVISRKRRMEGYNVLYPIGFDAFGLPTENYAIKTGRPPAEVTAENIANFTRQLKSLGYSFDWSRSVDTTDPKYYKWTQWIFLKLFEHGLAYKKNVPINWCLSCKIGLANEEIVDGKCERCGGNVEKRDKEQWMLKITDYAEKLLEGLDTVDYITRAKVQQQNWIGKSEGALVKFKIANAKAESDSFLEVFTTRPDTLFGATYMVVAPEHAILEKERSEITNFDEIESYARKARLKSDLERTELQKEKTGVQLEGITAINPVTGKQIPIFVADYVLPGYGTGAIMAVPAHDERDFAFAQKYNLPIVHVVAQQVGERKKDYNPRKTVRGICRKDGKILLEYDTHMNEYVLPGGGVEEGENLQEALVREIAEECGYTDVEIQGSLGSIEHNYFHHKRENDWRVEESAFLVDITSDTQIDRPEEEIAKIQYDWYDIDDAIEKLEKGSPTFYRSKIFLERAKQGETFSYFEEGIAVNSDFLNGLTTQQAKEKMILWLEENNIGHKKVNYKLRDWIFSRQRYWGEPIPLVYCENCASKKQFQNKGEELNPGWIPLSSDMLPLELPQVEKYEPTDTGESPLSTMDSFLNTTCPRCSGEAKRETDVMPNWAGSSWYWLRYMDPHNDQCFASKENLQYWGQVDWYNGGMEHTVLHLLYSRFWNQFLHDISEVPFFEPYAKRTSHGLIMAEDGEKMSKSRGNVVNPDDMIEQFGTDALRTYIMFMGPFDQHVSWSTDGLKGVRRFLERVWNLQEKVKLNEEKDSKNTGILHKTIKKVSEDIDEMRFNTAVSAMMELTNAFYKEDTISQTEYSVLLKLLSPFAPHICEELWSEFLGNTNRSLAYEPWPVFDPLKMVEDTVTLAIQVNGKVRSTLEVSSDIEEAEATARALADENVQKWLAGQEPKKIIYIKGKLISIVM